MDEFAWVKTNQGCPGGWPNRVKCAWEGVYHFCRQPQIKFRPTAVGHISEDCFDYSPLNPKSRSGSGLLGAGARGSATGQQGAADANGHFAGIARPSNVIEVKTETSQGSHSAPFPRGLVEFFVKAFSDEGDIVGDMFLGSGTVIAAAHVLGRVGYGIEISRRTQTWLCAGSRTSPVRSRSSRRRARLSPRLRNRAVFRWTNRHRSTG